jgi:hypothetical protein
MVVLPGLGLGTGFHAVPFQCAARELLRAMPTTQALVGEVTATPDKVL